MDRIASAIAEHAASLAYDALPPAVVHGAKQHFIDTIACALGGFRCDAAAIGRRIAAGAVPALLPGRVVGARARTTAESAAFVNGAMIRYLDYNDTTNGGHPSDALGAVLAVAESAGADGKRLLSGLVVAYETAVRLITTMKLRERGWDQGFPIGVAAAAATGHMLRLPAAKIAHGVAITAVANVPLRATRVGALSKWKGAATAFACRNAVFAMEMAGDGMTGPAAPFTGRHGVFEQLGGEFALDYADAYLTPQVSTKFWPVENNAQGAVWAARELRGQFTAAEIAGIDITCSTGTWREIGSDPSRWDPKTREDADHSLPYIFVRAFIDGEITVASFDEGAYLDPALRPLLAKIRVHRDEEIDKVFPGRVLMRVALATGAGARHEIEIADPRGHPKNPMDDGELSQKFLRMAAPLLPQAKAEAALAMLWQIEREASLAPLFTLLEAEG
jgi:2-methylcitrate dehydratase